MITQMHNFMHRWFTTPWFGAANEMLLEKLLCFQKKKKVFLLLLWLETRQRNRRKKKHKTVQTAGAFDPVRSTVLIICAMPQHCKRKIWRQLGLLILYVFVVFHLRLTKYLFCASLIFVAVWFLFQEQISESVFSVSFNLVCT